MKKVSVILLIALSTSSAFADGYDWMRDEQMRAAEQQAEFRRSEAEYRAIHEQRANEIWRDISRTWEPHPEADALNRINGELMLMENHSR